MLTVGTMPRLEQLDEPEPPRVMLRARENLCPRLLCPCKVQGMGPEGMSRKMSMASEAGLLKVMAPSTGTVIDFTAEAEVVPLTIRIDEGLEVAGKRIVVDGSTPFSGQSAATTSRASETGSKR